MEKDRKYRIGLNLASMLPWSAIPAVGLPLAAWMTKWAGYAFWQVLPLRSVSVEGLKATGIPVRFAEPAWNPTTFWGQLTGKLGAEEIPATWLDVAFFPNPQASQRRFEMILNETGVQPIYHRLRPARSGALVEVYPGLRATSVYLAQFAAGIDLKPYVIDTRHLRRPGSEHEGESQLGPWQEALELLLPYTALVHVQPLDGEELQRSLDGEITEMVQMLMYTWGRYKGPFVIEIPPNILGPAYFMNPRRIIKVLSEVRELVKADI